MFQVTFLGHQGWLVATRRAAVLIDPLLREEFGDVQRLRYAVYPPRVMDRGALPPIDAVILTHEHDDHFDLPSLVLLDRRIPIHLSAHASSAARTILVEMGFKVHALTPGVALLFKDLKLLAMPGDHVNTSSGDEWDTLPFLAWDMGGHGSFFSTVDVVPTQRHIATARALVVKPGLVTHTNNHIQWWFQNSWSPSHSDYTPRMTQEVLNAYAELCALWSTPQAVLMCGGGFAFSGEKAWLNRLVFGVDNDRVCNALGAMSPRQRFFSTRPGQTFLMEGGMLARVDEKSPFLATAPRESWPARAQDPSDAEVHQRVDTFEPLGGRKDFDKPDIERLVDHLTTLARALYGGPLFRRLHSLYADDVKGRIPTVALVLHRARKEPLVYAYDAAGCTFTLSQHKQPKDVFLATIDAWASDVLDVLSGECGPLGMGWGHVRGWSAMPDAPELGFLGELNLSCHPLARPAEYLKLYRKIVSGLATETRVRFAG